MITLKPELLQAVPLSMKTSDPRHIGQAGAAGFAGSYDHGGIISRAGSGAAIAELGSAIGAGAVLRDGSAGTGGVSFSSEMLKALDRVSGLENETYELAEKLATGADGVDAHDVTIAHAKAREALDIARTVLSRLTQAWKDIINTR